MTAAGLISPWAATMIASLAYHVSILIVYLHIVYLRATVRAMGLEDLLTESRRRTGSPRRLTDRNEKTL